MDLRQSGFVPDVMLGHNGWGEIWYLRDIFPQTPLVGYFEFFYRLHGADVGFDPADPITPDTAPRLRTKNLGNLLALDTANLGQCPTQWQKAGYPKRYHPILHVIHEGIDTQVAAPDPQARLSVPNTEIHFAAGDEVVTYVARNLEPYRGFPLFMRSLPSILERRPKAHVVIVGGDEVSYGARLSDGRTYRQESLKELQGSLDLARVHFLGRVPYSTFIKVLQISRVHVYLTYPFVLSWSMLEAMSAGCLIVGSRTPPVEEVIRDCGNGVLVDFFSPGEIADRVVEALQDPHAHDSIRRNARQTVIDEYDLRTVCLPAHLHLLVALARQSHGPKRTVDSEPRIALTGARMNMN
jgi:glycosyltransferase involved in cell wall biosynthesis